MEMRVLKLTPSRNRYERYADALIALAFLLALVQLILFWKSQRTLESMFILGITLGSLPWLLLIRLSHRVNAELAEMVRDAHQKRAATDSVIKRDYRPR